MIECQEKKHNISCSYCSVCTTGVLYPEVSCDTNAHMYYTRLKLTVFFFFFFFHLTYSRWTSSLPSCMWSQRIFPSLPGSRLTNFLSRCKFSTLTTRQPMVEFYLLTFPRFPLRKKEHKSYFGKNRTHDFRTSRCAAYLLDHSGDERLLYCGISMTLIIIYFVLILLLYCTDFALGVTCLW